MSGNVQDFFKNSCGHSVDSESGRDTTRSWLLAISSAGAKRDQPVPEGRSTNLEEICNFLEGRAQIVPRRSIYEIKTTAPTVDATPMGVASNNLVWQTKARHHRGGNRGAGPCRRSVRRGGKRLKILDDHE
jgi:hypothetical protein